MNKTKNIDYTEATVGNLIEFKTGSIYLIVKVKQNFFKHIILELLNIKDRNDKHAPHFIEHWNLTLRQHEPNWWFICKDTTK